MRSLRRLKRLEEGVVEEAKEELVVTPKEEDLMAGEGHHMDADAFDSSRISGQSQILF